MTSAGLPFSYIGWTASWSFLLWEILTLEIFLRDFFLESLVGFFLTFRCSWPNEWNELQALLVLDLRKVLILSLMFKWAPACVWRRWFELSFRLVSESLDLGDYFLLSRWCSHSIVFLTLDENIFFLARYWELKCSMSIVMISALISFFSLAEDSFKN